jgi:hypothetical protein
MDFGFVGPSYEAPSIYQDAQECINFFPEVDPLKEPGQRGVVALYPTPGLNTVAVLNSGEIRGMRTVSGGQQMVVVCGAYVYVLTSNLTPSIVGFLNTTTGRVGITDNGINVYIVDGAYRYTWRISTPATALFTGSVSGTTLTVTAISNGTLAIGQQLFGVGVSGETVITALGSGTGGTGTYTLNNSQTISSETLSTAAAGAIITASIGETLSGVKLASNGGFSCTAPSTKIVVGASVKISGTLSSSSFTLSSVVITGTNGQFSCTSTTLNVGQQITISGTFGGTGSITGYKNPTTYLISVTNGTTTFTLTNLDGSAIVTTAGTPTGLTYTVLAPSIIGYTNPKTYYVVTTDGSTFFTLSETSGGSPITTTGGPSTGLTLVYGTNYLNVSAVTTGTLYLGQTIQTVGIAFGTIITNFGTGSGDTGTYLLSTTNVISSGTMYALNFTQIPSTDGAFSGGNTVDTVDNYFVYNRPNTQQFGASDALSPISPALSFASKDGSPDNLVSIIVDHREVYLLGETSSEVWIDVGAIPFPFQRIPGTSTQHGIAAVFSMARLANSFAYVSRNNRGQGMIVQMNGYIPQRISTHAVENTLVNKYIDDAIAYTYQLEGHECYVVTFPTIDLTWVYDVTTQMWHKWLSVDNANVYHRHRSNCSAVFQNMVLVGDYANGKIYELDLNTYTDDGNEIRRLRRAPHLVADLQRQYFDEFQIQFQPGVGTTGFYKLGADINIFSPYVILPYASLVIGALDNVILGNKNTINDTDVTTYPQAMLRWSNDGGSTWSSEYWVTIGSMGRFKNRAIWRRLGMARDRVFEVVITDPVKAVIVSANLKASTGDN